MVPQYYYKLCIKFRCVRGYCTGRTEGLRAWRRLPVLVSKVLNLSPNFLRLVNPGNLVVLGDIDSCIDPYAE